jgi:transketolase
VAEKWRAFGWHVLEVDGHDFDVLIPAMEEAKRTKGRPTCIIAHTIKGKGVSFMEGDYNWHAKAPNNDELAKALAELETQRPR